MILYFKIIIDFLNYYLDGIILTNKEIIAINQDALGIQGFKYQSENGVDVWVKPLFDENWAVVFLNRSDKTQKINFDWKKHIIEDNDFKFILNLTSQKYNVRDLWEHIDLGNTNKIFQKELASHDVIAIKLTKVKK